MAFGARDDVCTSRLRIRYCMRLHTQTHAPTHHNSKHQPAAGAPQCGLPRHWRAEKQGWALRCRTAEGKQRRRCPAAALVFGCAPPLDWPPLVPEIEGIVRGKR